MRLTQQEIDALVQAVGEFLTSNSRAELRLFGSRVDDCRKGGDIDLLLIVTEVVVDSLQMQKHLILARMKELMGEQKIDLKITARSSINTDPFLQLVYPDSVVLKKW